MNKYERLISVIMLLVISVSNFATPVVYAAPLVKVHVPAFGVPKHTTFMPSGTITAVGKILHQGQGSVLGATTSLLNIGTQELDLRQSIGTSAQKRIPIQVQELDKKVYRTDENVTFAVINPDNDAFTTSVHDVTGHTLNVPVTESNTGSTTTVDLVPSNTIKPGLYKITVTDSANHSTEQDFTWGVLALNPDKSMYHPGDKADIAMAVLNDKGDMVCDAQVTLAIQYSDGTGTELSTSGVGDNKITVSDQCQKHDYSLQPDYEGHYTFTSAGTYTLTLTAHTINGTHTITDTIQVKDSTPFDVQRVSATRIYPPNSYPMIFNITANQDFNGIVTETVPDSFVITPSTESAVRSYSDMQTVYLNSTDPAALMSQQIASASGGLVMPFHGTYPITQGFGMQLTDPSLQAFYIHYGLGGHDGIDFGLPMNTPLYAVDEGDVIWSGPGDYGTMVTLQHGWGKTYYGHMTNTSVTVGQHVTKGQLIGYSGMTGEATGPHLHFGMKPNNPDMTNGYYGKIDPMPFLPIGQGEPIAALGASANPVANLVYNTTVLGASDSAATPTPSDTPSPTPLAATPTLTVAATPTPTTAPTVSPTPSAATPTVSATPTPTPELTPKDVVPANTNSNFTVLDQEIKLNEQIANNALTDKVKVITWKVNLKKGESTTLGYAYQAPKVSPQFYLLGPAKFYAGGNERVVFQEDRQWQIASDDVGVDWYQNNGGPHNWNGYSWQYRRKIDIDHTKVTADSPSSGSQPAATFMEGGTDEDGSISPFYLSNPITGESGFGADCTGITIAAHTGPCSAQLTAASTPGYLQANSGDSVDSTNPVTDSGSRISAYFAISAAPSVNDDIIQVENASNAEVFSVRLSTGRLLQLVEGSTTIGSIGTHTIATGTWTRISVAYTITNSTTYSIKVYVNGVQDISVSNPGVTLPAVTSARVKFGYVSAAESGSTINIDDLYIDSGTDLSDIGDVRVTNKRAFANGATNSFTTSGTGSGYGSGNAPWVNKATESTLTSVTSTTSNAVEEYTIEGASVGYVDVSSQNIIAQEFFLTARDSVATCTSNSDIIYNGSSTVIPSLISTAHTYYKLQTTSTYPSGNTAIGFQHCNNTNNEFVHEAGVDIAYIIPTSTTPTTEFMESGTDATQDLKFFQDATGDSFNLSGVSSDSTIKETGTRSLKLTDTAGANPGLAAPLGSVGSSSRVSLYVYFDNMVNTGTIDFTNLYDSTNTFLGAPVTLNTSDKLQCADGTTTGTTTLTTGTWYRISFAYVYSSGTPAKLTTRVYLNGRLEIDCGAQSEPGTDNLVPSFILFGSDQTNQTIHIDDIYADNGSDYSDTGDIHVTAKRPLSNGASNQFTASGSPSGFATGATGNAQYVSERPLNTSANVAVSVANDRENYTIESASQGDTDVSNAGLIADEAWVYGKTSSNCTGKITNNGTDSSISLVSTGDTMFTAIASSTSFPSGTQAVGIQSCTSTQTVTLEEAGVQIAYTNNDPTKTLTNFPVLVSLSSDSDLNAHAQGSGNDIVFTDSTGRNLLNYEIESYSAGTLVAWVQIPALSSTTDTIIYMYYGNPSAASQSTSSTWSNGFAGVWHLPNGSVLSTNDSTSYANNGTNHSATATTGEIDGGGSFSGTSQYIDVSTAASEVSTGNVTFSFWFNPTSTWSNPGNSNYDSIMMLDDATSTNDVSILLAGQSAGCATGKLEFKMLDGASSPHYDCSTETSWTGGTWYYGAITYSSSGDGMDVYINGAFESNNSTFSRGTTKSASFDLGADPTGTTISFGGKLDELRASYTARSAGWISTEYNNENSPTTFDPISSTVESDIYAPTMDKIMRHGEFFDSTGSLQPFVF